MGSAENRHDISDQIWERLKPLLPGQAGQWEGIAKDNRRFINESHLDKKDRKVQKEYNTDLYKLRHFVENAFLHLTHCQGIATRYAKNAASFLAAVQIRCIALWAEKIWRHNFKKHNSFIGYRVKLLNEALSMCCAKG